MAFEQLVNISGSSWFPGLIAVIIMALIWKLIWYGLALYKAIEKKQKAWFVVLFIASFVLNDLGILAIIYLLLNQNKKRR